MTERPHIHQSDEAVEDRPFRAVLDIISEAAETAESGTEVSLRDLIIAFGDRAFGPIMVLAGIFIYTPLGILPGVPSALGLIVMAFAVQMLMRRPYPWLPQRLDKVKLKSEKLAKTRMRAEPIFDVVDNVIRPRLKWAVTGPMRIIAACVAILMSALMFPLGFVPFGVLVPGLVILLMGLAITARDGALMLIALAISIGGPALLAYYFL